MRAEKQNWKRGRTGSIDSSLRERNVPERIDRDGEGGIVIEAKYRRAVIVVIRFYSARRKKGRKTLVIWKTPRIEGAMLGEFVSFSISCSIEEHAGAEVDAEKRVQRKMEGKRERIQAMQAWIGEVGSYEREDKGYTHIHIYIYTYRELPISKERAKGSPVCEV